MHKLYPVPVSVCSILRWFWGHGLACVVFNILPIDWLGPRQRKWTTFSRVVRRLQTDLGFSFIRATIGHPDRPLKTVN